MVKARTNFIIYRKSWASCRCWSCSELIACLCAAAQVQAEGWPALPLSLIKMKHCRWNIFNESKRRLAQNPSHALVLRPAGAGHSCTRLLINDMKQNREKYGQKRKITNTGDSISVPLSKLLSPVNSDASSLSEPSATLLFLCSC